MNKIIFYLFTILFLAYIYSITANAGFFAEEYHGAAIQGNGDPIFINSGETMDFKLCKGNYCEFLFEEDHIFVIDFILYGKTARIDFVNIDRNAPSIPHTTVQENIAKTIEMSHGSIEKPYCYIVTSDESGTAAGTMTFKVSKDSYYLVFRTISSDHNLDYYITATISYSPLSKSSPETGAENIYPAISIFLLSASFVIFKILKRRKT